MNRCTANDCTKPARSRTARWCEMHYNRIRRHGHPGLAPIRSRGVCPVEGCTQLDKGPNGLCGKHRERVRSHGDPTVSHAGSGQLSPSWRGSDIKYRAAHERVQTQHGPAFTHACVNCGSQASHWSYNHDDPDELFDQKLRLPFSTDPAHYSPRCVPCHKLFDLTRERASA